MTRSTPVYTDLTIFSATGTASNRNVRWVELPPGIENLAVTGLISGFAPASASINLVGSQTTSSGSTIGSYYFNFKRYFSSQTSATYHQFTEGQYPKYLGIITSATVSYKYTVIAHFTRRV